MKKIFTIMIILSAYQSEAQEPADALRYSWFTSSGTARQQAIGGAMTSLGGEISATFVNPAGLGFYKTGDFVLTPGFNSLKNNSTYFGRKEKDEKYGFAFGTSGIVLGGGMNNRKNGMKGAALSLAINQTANFGSNILYRGINTQSSYSQKFLEEIRNDRDANSVAGNYPFGTSLAFNTYWIDTIAGGSSGNYQFQTRAPITTGLIQENKIINKGGITELALAGAANYNDKFFIGATIGLPFLHYKKEGVFTEADLTENTTNKFDYASISENLTTDGVGINLKAGIIYKPVEQIRLGLALHSPTWYTLTDKYNASVTTNTEGYKGLLTQSSDLFTNGKDAEFKYSLLTPYRIMASASYVLREIEDVRKQKGFLTVDIEYVNYKASSFKTDPEGDNTQSTKDYLKSLNRAIDNSFKGAFNFKAGGELKFTTIMARLGAAYYGNPYQNLNGAKGNKFQLTGGLGYRNKGIFLDVAYVYTMGKDVHFPYRLQTGNYSGASIKQTGGNVLLTLGFKI
jgi:long-subunit fatty acid transport protein